MVLRLDCHRPLSAVLRDAGLVCLVHIPLNPRLRHDEEAGSNVGPTEVHKDPNPILPGERRRRFDVPQVRLPAARSPRLDPDLNGALPGGAGREQLRPMTLRDEPNIAAEETQLRSDDELT